jgi:hypothetical protein
MAKTKDLRQTAIRLSPELLRLAKYYLDEEDSNLQKFLSEKLEHYVQCRSQEKLAMSRPSASLLAPDSPARIP